MKVGEKMKENKPSFPGLQLADLPQSFSGKILLRKEIPLDEKTFQYLLSTNSFTSIKSIIRKKLTYQCQRCGNLKRSLFASISCLICKKSHIYCRKCIEMGRVTECEPLYVWTGENPEWLKHEDPCTWEGELTEAQRAAGDRIVQAIQI